MTCFVRPRLAVYFWTLVLGSGLLAGSAYTGNTHETPRTVRYECDDGGRFAAEFDAGHVRVRSGTGIFMLVRQPADAGTQYSDGTLMLWTDGLDTTFEHAGIAARSHCRPRPYPDGKDA